MICFASDRICLGRDRYLILSKAAVLDAKGLSVRWKVPNVSKVKLGREKKMCTAGCKRKLHEGDILGWNRSLFFISQSLLFVFARAWHSEVDFLDSCRKAERRNNKIKKWRFSRTRWISRDLRILITSRRNSKLRERFRTRKLYAKVRINKNVNKCIYNIMEKHFWVLSNNRQNGKKGQAEAFIKIEETYKEGKTYAQGMYLIFNYIYLCVCRSVCACARALACMWLKKI